MRQSGFGTRVGARRFLDEDTLVSDDALAVASQQSIKAYADSLAATQAVMETGTATTTYSTPGRQMFHKAHAKVVLFGTYSTGTPTDSFSVNVASLDDDATGDVGIHFTTAFSDANIVALITGNQAAGGADRSSVDGIAAGAVEVQITSGSGDVDLPWGFIAFGDQV